MGEPHPFLAFACLLVMASQAGLAQAADEIHVGGAVRFQYSYEDYDADNRERAGDLDLDTVRLNLDGTLKGLRLSAEWRYYQYMQVIHHAWVGYAFSDTWQGELGITRVPFGNLPFNSHGFFFSSNYYLGLEDDYDAGIKLLYQRRHWDLRLAFFKNDEQGGIDGFVDNRSDRYSYDIVGERSATEGTFAEPALEIGETNTFVGRLAYSLTQGDERAMEVGLSGLRGQLFDHADSVGDYWAAAVHLNGTYGRWNVQVQLTGYQYDLDSGNPLLAVGAYSFFDTIPAEATSYTANLAYRLPVTWGPVEALTFYSDNSWITDKSAALDDTVMNVLGVSVAAGPVFAYLDFISAKNQPFIGGSLGAEGERNARINFNVGYYF